MFKNKRIVVTGLGPLSAIGVGKQALWESIKQEKTGLTLDNFSVDGEQFKNYYVHRIKNFDINNFGIKRDILENIISWKEQENPIDLFYLLAVIKLALDDARIDYNNNNVTKGLGLILTHENPGLDQFYEDVINHSYDFLFENKEVTRKEYFQEFYRKFAKKGYELQTFMLPFHVAKVFNIHAYSIFLCNACASGLFALEAAADMIRSGKCDTVVVGGSDYTSVFKYLWFKGLGVYAEDGKIKPFAKNRNGFVTGDGGAGIVLESLDKAKKRRAHIYAEYLGGGFDLEGWKVSVPDLNSDSYRRVIEKAIQNAGISKRKIDLIIPHGVGTTATDYYEAKAISDIFGENCQKPFITALKPYIGHNLGSTSLLETVISLLALKNDYIPATLNITNTDPKLKIRIICKPIAKKLKNILKIACGFAGYNAAAIFKKIN